MIAENENTEPEVISEVKRKNVGRNDMCPCNSGKKYKNCHIKSDKMLLPTELRSLIHILVTQFNGVAVSQKKFDEYPQDAEMVITYDSEKQRWFFMTPKPEKKPKLLVPKNRIILPNMEN